MYGYYENLLGNVPFLTYGYYQNLLGNVPFSTYGYYENLLIRTGINPNRWIIIIVWTDPTL